MLGVVKECLIPAVEDQTIKMIPVNLPAFKWTPASVIDHYSEQLAVLGLDQTKVVFVPELDETNSIYTSGTLYCFP